MSQGCDARACIAIIGIEIHLGPDEEEQCAVEGMEESEAKKKIARRGDASPNGTTRDTRRDTPRHVRRDDTASSCQTDFRRAEPELDQRRLVVRKSPLNHYE